MKFSLPTHLYIIQAVLGSLGTSLDIKFPLNSLRIEQLHLSNYHRFVIMKGGWKRHKEGHGDQRQSCSGPRGQRDPWTQRHRKSEYRTRP